MSRNLTARAARLIWIAAALFVASAAGLTWYAWDQTPWTRYSVLAPDSIVETIDNGTNKIPVSKADTYGEWRLYSRQRVKVIRDPGPGGDGFRQIFVELIEGPDKGERGIIDRDWIR